MSMNTVSEGTKDFFKGHAMDVPESSNCVDLKRVYSLYDVVTYSYDAPFLAENDAVAIRTMKDCLLRDSMLTRHPEDYNLVYLSSFNVKTGDFCDINKKFVCSIKELVNPSTKQAGFTENGEVVAP